MSNAYLHAKSEPDLACLQSEQFGNACSFHAISAALRLLLDYELDPLALEAEIDHIWWRGRPMRVFPGWAVTPRMQKRIVNYLAETRALPITAEFIHSDPDTLPLQLTDLSAVPLVTLLWGFGKAPAIYHGALPINLNDRKGAGGHTMLFAAHDPTHTTGAGISTPWGFINSWCDGGARLYWMKDGDFRRSWGFFLPLVGPNPLVLIRKTL